MSRWHDTYNNHPFQNSWKQIVAISPTLSTPDETIKTSVEEIARLRKAVTFINELIEAVDPELIPIPTWDMFYSQSNDCLVQINAYFSDQNIAHIQNANSNLDNLLSYIRPYMVNARAAAIAAGRAFKEYSEAVEFHIDQLNEKAKAAIDKTKIYQEQAERIVEEIGSSQSKINELEIKLFDGENDDKALEEKAEELVAAIESSNEKI